MNQKPNNQHDPDMLPEYDFSGGVRGKYVDRFAKGCNVVVLDPDVARVFTDSECKSGATCLGRHHSDPNGKGSTVAIFFSYEHVEQLVGPERREPMNCGFRIANCGFDFAPPGLL